MFTMTAREIKDVLRRNRREGRWPRSLNQLAIAHGVSRSMMTTAVKRGRRYPSARRFIESVLSGADVVAREKAS